MDPILYLPSTLSNITIAVHLFGRWPWVGHGEPPSICYRMVVFACNFRWLHISCKPLLHIHRNPWLHIPRSGDGTEAGGNGGSHPLNKDTWRQECDRRSLSGWSLLASLPSNPSISLHHCQAILDYTSPASFDYISLAGVVCISASTPSPALFFLLWGHQVWARRSNFLSTSKNQLPFIIPLSSFLRLLLLFIFFK